MYSTGLPPNLSKTSISLRNSTTCSTFSRYKSKSQMESQSKPMVEITTIKRRRPERTPDQIARKRDQDREAQRLSRERTRRRIEEAETRLVESQAAASRYQQELKLAVEERDAAHRESNDLRLQLESAYSQLEAARNQIASVAHLIGGNAASIGSPCYPSLNGFNMPMEQTSQLQSPQPSESGHLSRSPARSERLSVRAMSYHHSASPTLSATMENSIIGHPPMYAMSHDDSSSQGSPCYGADGSTYGSEFSGRSWHDLSAYLPINGPPTCPMDNILAIFSNSRRELLRQGEPEDVVLGPMDPSLSVLPALRDYAEVGMCHPVSQMLAEVMGAAASLEGLPEQIAVLWLTHISLRVSIISQIH